MSLLTLFNCLKWVLHLKYLFFVLYCSRSQCIINISNVSNKSAGENDVEVNDAVLSIIDLAGAEREKRTGNQVSPSPLLPYVIEFCIELDGLMWTFIGVVIMAYAQQYAWY